jgi:CHAD domain-containing protein
MTDARARGSLPTLEAVRLQLDPVTELDGGATELDVLRSALAKATMRFVRLDPIVRLGEDPEGVHRARVSVRRMRSDLRTFRPLLDRTWADGLRAELAWVGDLLGPVRDTEVLRARLRRRIAGMSDPGMAAGKVLLDELEADRLEARRRLLIGMRSGRYAALVEALVDGARLPRGLGMQTDGPSATGSSTAGPWRGLRRRVRRLGTGPDDAALHAVRIRSKRVRYAAEAFAPVLGRPAARFGSAARKLQDALGDHQDAVVAAAWLVERGTDTDDAPTAFAAGRLAELELEERDHTRMAWRDPWARLKRRKRFWT